jgi:hypothetical protein
MDLWVLTNVEHPSKHQSNRAQKFPAPSGPREQSDIAMEEPWELVSKDFTLFFSHTQLYKLVASRTAARQIAAACLASCVGPRCMSVSTFDTCFLSHSS